MEWLTGARIALTPRPVQRREAALEVAMLGHYPNPKNADGTDARERARVARLLSLPAALDDMRAAGFGDAVDALLASARPGAAPLSPALAGLFHLPIPLRASAEFHDIFPDSAAEPTHYVSLLAGRRAWLAQAVDDFFANGGEKLWVVRIPERHDDPAQADQLAFLPAPNTQLHDVRTLRGLASVLVIPALAVVAFPDLERLQVPATLPDIPRVRLDNPDPQFLPLGDALDDDHRERRYPSELNAMQPPLALDVLLRGLLGFVQRHRPDVQCLLTLPLEYSGEAGSPALDRVALKTLQALRAQPNNAPLLRQVQCLFPYLRGPRFELQSPVGVIAGKQAAIARTKGPWHSIGAQPLLSEGLPYPRLSIAGTLALRDDPGVGVLQVRNGFAGRTQLSLDDERLLVPALPLADYAGALNDNGEKDPSRHDGFRAAEIQRFLGFLRRQLQALGEQLVFNVDVNDPRPRLLLEQFFRRLYNQGALRGALPEEAFQIRQSQLQESALQFDIQIAPAFPIDRIFLTFINVEGEWQAEVGHA